MGLDILLLIATLLAIILIGLYVQIRRTQNYGKNEFSTPHQCEHCSTRKESLSLRLSKGPEVDDGLGLARLGKCSQNILGVNPGDAVLVEAKDIVSALVADAPLDSNKDDIVILDHELVKILDSSYGDIVLVRKNDYSG